MERCHRRTPACGRRESYEHLSRRDFQHPTPETKLQFMIDYQREFRMCLQDPFWKNMLGFRCIIEQQLSLV
jgi:hypothetical protein